MTGMPASELDRFKHAKAAQDRAMSAMEARAKRAEQAEASLAAELARCRRQRDDALRLAWWLCGARG